MEGLVNPVVKVTQMSKSLNEWNGIIFSEARKKGRKKGMERERTTELATPPISPSPGILAISQTSSFTTL